MDFAVFTGNWKGKERNKILAEYDIKKILQEVEEEIGENDRDVQFPAFHKGRKQEFASETFSKERLEDCLAQSWNMGYIEMEVAPSLSELKKKIKEVVARVVGICLLPVCRKQTLYNLNSAETLHLLYAKMMELEKANKSLQMKIEMLEKQIQKGTEEQAV